MSGILHKNSDGKILYAIAIENHRTKVAGFTFVHAKSKLDATNQILASKQLAKGSRVIAVAPAVGVRYTTDARGNVKDVLL